MSPRRYQRPTMELRKSIERTNMSAVTEGQNALQVIVRSNFTNIRTTECTEVKSAASSVRGNSVLTK
jgi:hypothetical protein